MRKCTKLTICIVMLLVNTPTYSDSSYIGNGEGYGSTVAGINNTAKGLYSSSVGRANKASGESSSAFGWENTASGLNSSAFGKFNTASGESSNAFGWENTASGLNSSAFGKFSKASGESSSAFGWENIASGLNGNAFGYYNAAISEHTIAMGFKNAATNKNTTALGWGNNRKINDLGEISDEYYISGENSSALGYWNLSLGDNSNAIGYRNITLGNFSNAFGIYNSSEADYSTAIGYQAVAKESDTISFGHSRGDEIGYKDGTYDKDYNSRLVHVATGTADTDAVNYGQLKYVASNFSTYVTDIGLNGGNRRITMIAPGVNDSDAVNYGQIKGAYVNASYDEKTGVITFTKLDKTSENFEIKSLINNTDGSLNNSNSSNINNNNKGSDNGSPVKYSDTAKSLVKLNGVNGTTISGIKDGKIENGSTEAINGGQIYNSNNKLFQAIEDLKRGISIDSENQNKIESEFKGNVAIGSMNEVINETSEPSLAIGNGNIINGSNNVAVGAKHKINGRNSGAFGDPHIITGDDSYALGNSNFIIGNQNYAIGNSTKVSGTGNFAIGNNSSIKDCVNSLSFGNNTQVKHNNSLVLGEGSVSSSDNSVSVGAPGRERKIQNVERGTEDTDAVNYGQLRDYVATNALGSDDQTILRLRGEIENLDTKINRVGAGAAALAALKPLDSSLDSKWSAGIGFGNLHGKSAAAIGAFYRPSRDVIYSIGANVGGEDRMVNASINFAFGHRTKRTEKQICDDETGIVDCLKIETLIKENTILKSELAELKVDANIQNLRIKRLEHLILKMMKDYKNY